MTFTNHSDIDAEMELILRSALSGDELSRQRIIESCRTYLLAIAQGYLDDPLRAKIGSSDIVQETCIKAHAAFDQFRGQSYPELLAWLRQCLANNLADVRRKYRGAQQRDVSREVPATDESQKGRGAIVDPLLTPSSAADLGEQVTILRSALLQLPEEYRQVILWRNWDQMNFAEIGQRLQRSEEAARKLWNRAVAKLAEYLPGEDEG
jgi:RNA polymerase sigma-70 factor (ECF subfamily)